MGIENLLTKDEIDAAKLAEMGEDEREELKALAGDDDDEDGADDDGKAEDEGGQTEAKGGTDEKDEKDADDDRPDAPSTFAPAFDAGDPKAFDEQLKSIREQRAALTKAWRSGEIEDDEYDGKLAELDDQKDSVIEQRATARAAITMSQQTAQQAFEHDRQSFLRNMERYEGVPYSKTPMLAAAFAQELRAAGQRAIDEKRDPSAGELFEEAHAKVIEQMRGLGMTIGRARQAPEGGKPEGKTDGKAEDAGKPRQVPRTLSGLPNAAPSGGVGDDLLQQAANLEGEDLEIFVARLPEDKRRALESA